MTQNEQIERDYLDSPQYELDDRAHELSKFTDDEISAEIDRRLDAKLAEMDRQMAEIPIMSGTLAMLDGFTTNLRGVARESRSL